MNRLISSTSSLVPSIDYSLFHMIRVNECTNELFNYIWYQVNGKPLKLKKKKVALELCKQLIPL